MNKKLIRNWNERVKPEDTVYHLGDFCFHSGQEGSTVKAREWEAKLNGNIVHICGNHDKNNGVKTVIIKAVGSIGGDLVYLTHKPPQRRSEVPKGCKYVLCGHVHEKWKHTYTKEDRRILLVNVGTDVRKFRPFGLDELMNYVKGL